VCAVHIEKRNRGREKLWSFHDGPDDVKYLASRELQHGCFWKAIAQSEFQFVWRSLRETGPCERRRWLLQASTRRQAVLQREMQENLLESVPYPSFFDSCSTDCRSTRSDSHTQCSLRKDAQSQGLAALSQEQDLSDGTVRLATVTPTNHSGFHLLFLPDLRCKTSFHDEVGLKPLVGCYVHSFFNSFSFY